MNALAAAGRLLNSAAVAELATPAGTHARRLDDYHRAGQVFLAEFAKGIGNALEPPVRSEQLRDSHQDDTSVPAGRIQQDVAELSIRGDHGSSIRNGRVEDFAVRLGAQAFADYVNRVHASLHSGGRKAEGKVLVDEEPRHLADRANLVFLQQLCGVPQRREDVVVRDGEFAFDSVHVPARGEVSNDSCHRHARAHHHGLSVTNRGIDTDSGRDFLHDV